ncbi:chaperone NapD [Shewanella algae]|uniref:chaperone NapD n=1 Tax=Shewanella algae TaxID=38313 RepID=UPI001AAC579B|nr:chaperone NapD [Shewanella algae]MBO2569389.1 chaperone NapD [Shewanella algae]
MSRELHVSSLILQVMPPKMASVRQQILSFGNAELSVNDESKLVVVLEGPTEQAILATMDKINALKGVISTAMVYHQYEQLEEEEQ